MSYLLCLPLHLRTERLQAILIKAFAFSIGLDFCHEAERDADCFGDDWGHASSSSSSSLVTSAVPAAR